MAWKGRWETFRALLRDPLAKGIGSGYRAYTGPLTVQIDPTNRCNGRCLYCWARSPLLGENAADEKWQSQEIPIDRLVSLVDEIHALGTRHIHLAGGGEPFVHPHIMELIRHIKKKAIKLDITTNFTLLDRDRLIELVALGVETMTLSLWAADAETWRKLHPESPPGTFGQIEQNLSLLRKLDRRDRRPRIRIANVIARPNMDHLFAMIAFARSVGADACFFQVMDPVPGCTDLLLPDADERKLLLKILDNLAPEIRKAEQEGTRIEQLEEFRRRIGSEKADEGRYDRALISQSRCYAGWVFSRITADGNVNFCLKTDEYPVASIYRTPFPEIWFSDQYNYLRYLLFNRMNNHPLALRCHTTCDNTDHNLIAARLFHPFRRLTPVFTPVSVAGYRLRNRMRGKKRMSVARIVRNRRSGPLFDT